MGALRASWWLLVLSLAVPGALAQTGPVETATLVVEPFVGPIAPLQENAATPFTARISCLLLEPTTGTPVTYSVVAKPEWTNVTLSPSADVVRPAACQASTDGWATLSGSLSATVDAAAPAFEPADVTIEVLAGVGGPRQARAEATVPVEAGYFSILSVDLEEAIKVAPPDSTTRFPLVLSNLGNGASEVQFLVESATGPITVEVPPTFLLESPVTGNRSNRAQLDVLVHAEPASGFINKVTQVNLKVLSRYAQDPTLTGDETSVSLLLTVRSESLTKLETPAPALALALLALGLAAWSFRR